MARFQVDAYLMNHSALIPAGLLRFAIFIPLGVYNGIAEKHWNVIKRHALLQPGGPYDPTIAAAEKLAASWSKFGFWWTFAAWIPAMAVPAPLSLIFGAIDAAIAVQISLATHAQTSYAPHHIHLCAGTGAHDLQLPPGRNESFFEAAARLNATATDPVKMCKTFAQEWQYGVAISFFYSSIAFLSLSVCFVATTVLWRESRRNLTSFWKSTLQMFAAMPRVIIVLIVALLYYLPAVFFRCLPLGVKSRVRMARRSGIKAGQIIEEKSEIKMKAVMRKITRPGEKNVYVWKGDGKPTNLAEFLSIYDMLISVTKHLHYVDINNLVLVSKSVRESVLPADAYAQRMVHFKMYACRRSGKTKCWVCENQICKNCKHPRALKQTPAYFHLDTCQPFCTKCYYTTVHQPRGITLPTTATSGNNRNIMDPRFCLCAPVTPTPNIFQRYWNGEAYYRTRLQNVPYILRRVCRDCNRLNDEKLLEKREERTKSELKRGLWESVKRECVKCVECEKQLEGRRAVRWYYRSGNEWILYPGTTSGSASTYQPSAQQPSTEQPSAGQPSAEQPSSTGNPLSTVTSSTVADALKAFPQSSTEPYRQPQQLVFGINRQTPGKAAVPAITLDPNFRAAASRDMMIRGFVNSMDNIASGKV
ncbi:hypothetical protein CC80DRAFT_544348 [Byssothecium circinans]|uniref:Uncharacterized protein n=1 Tax=Byssothecium circinans TaxID=147558 RepID=A0A6A5U739_9PLEO|nr:hypothetical protein CC80DRAFT_544348 [Byssothecium circinans]